MSAPFNTIKASLIPGVVLDCVVDPSSANVGKTATGGTATDNTAAINGWLAAASATNPLKLILDGGTAMSQLQLPVGGYVEVEGIGRSSGVFIIAGSNNDCVNNGKILPADPQTTPPAQAGWVRLSNFTVNGNRGNGSNGNSNTGDPRGKVSAPAYFYCGIMFSNLSSVYIENMYVYDSPAYSTRLNNCGDTVIAFCRLENPCVTFTANQDCAHVDGPTADVRIIGNRMSNNNSDDGAAINVHEGYGGNGARIIIQGNVYVGTATALRVYGSTVPSAFASNVIFSGNTGTVNWIGILLGANIAGAGVDTAVQNMICAQNSLTITGAGGSFFSIQGNVGELVVSDCMWMSPVNSESVINFPNAATISALVIDNFTIYRNANGNATNTPLLSAAAASTIGQMTINGFQVSNQSGQSYSAIPTLLTMTNLTITSLYVGPLDYTNITAFADSYANIGTLAGPGYPNKRVIAANKTAAYTVVQTDAYLRGDATTATFAFTLPAGPYAFEEHEFIKVDSSANAVTIAGNGKTINGNASLGTQWSHVKMRYNGASWDSL